MKYKLRAECSMDVASFIAISGNQISYGSNASISEGIYPDEEFEFESYLNLEQLRSLLRRVVDGHVMVQTVQPADKYTGIRDYEIDTE